MTKATSILDQVRREAVRNSTSQLAQVQLDELVAAYNRGVRDAQDGPRERWRWRFGVLCGVALSALVRSFWP